MSHLQSRELVCPDCHNDAFEMSLLKDEQLGVIKCLQCNRDYLLLDTGDYWFDVIQQRPYPRPSRCGCKGTTFRLRLDYLFRDDGDVGSVVFSSTCKACGKTQRQFQVDVDYSPTGQLVERPLAYCKNPKLFYDLHDVSLYATRSDIAKIIRFLSEEGKCQFVAYACKNGQWDVGPTDVDQAEELVLAHTGSAPRYQWIYASAQPIAISNIATTARGEAAFWKRHEVICIRSPTYMMLSGIGGKASLLYTLCFSNESVAGERVVAKSQSFRDLTARLIDWLKTEFVTWRGKDCFDNPEEHLRAFGDRYRSKAAKKSREK